MIDTRIFWPTFSSATARARREATEKLAEDLASGGYTVWFDTRLLPMDVFWKVIRDEIKAAKGRDRDLVGARHQFRMGLFRSEMAHEMKKLICVRTAEVPAYDVPMPFNGYNVTPKWASARRSTTRWRR